MLVVSIGYQVSWLGLKFVKIIITVAMRNDDLGFFHGDEIVCMLKFDM